MNRNQQSTDGMCATSRALRSRWAEASIAAYFPQSVAVRVRRHPSTHGVDLLDVLAHQQAWMTRK
ncbi:TPA: hypothetical protein ACOFC4_004146, partial [Stenotrophomonas maltophilia]